MEPEMDANGKGTIVCAGILLALIVLPLVGIPVVKGFFVVLSIAVVYAMVIVTKDAIIG
jgi:hypothetical protein